MAPPGSVFLWCCLLVHLTLVSEARIVGRGRADRVSPKLISPKQDSTFFGRDYPSDEKPRSKRLAFQHPYHLVHDSDDFDKDFVKLDNNDNGLSAAQMPYDKIRAKVYRNASVSDVAVEKKKTKNDELLVQQEQRQATLREVQERQIVEHNTNAQLARNTTRMVCLGTPNAKQQLRGEVLSSLCARLGTANFLIFGTGWDSKFWADSNPHGHTRFLERHAQWVKIQPEQVQKDVTVVHYTSHLSDAMQHIHDSALLRQFLDSQVPEDIKKTQWDQILVDSPEGYDPAITSGQPGRGQSIFAASQLADDHTLVFVDDCNREVELAYITAHLLQGGRSLTKIDNGHGGTVCQISALH